MGAWQFSELDVLAPPERQLPVDLMHEQLTKLVECMQAPGYEHSGA